MLERLPALLARFEVTAAWTLGPRAGLVVVSADPPWRLTAEVAQRLVDEGAARVWRVAVRRSRSLEVERFDPGGRARARWPGEADVGASLDLAALLPDGSPAGVDDGGLRRAWDRALLADAVVEEVFARLGLPRHWAGAGHPVAAELGALALEVPKPEARFAREAGEGGRPFLAALERRRSLAALVVLPREAEGRALGVAGTLRERVAGCHACYLPSPARADDGDVGYLAAVVPLGEGPPAAELEAALLAVLDDELGALEATQALVALADWDPTLQVEHTPWEAAWDVEAASRRPSGWWRRELRGLADRVWLGADLAARVGEGPGWIDVEAEGFRAAEARLASLLPTGRGGPRDR